MTPSKSQVYRDLAVQLAALLEGESDRVANFANMAALIYHGLPDLNWAGFYLRQGNELVLGPFQGKPACVRIAIGRGVCGTAAARGETVLVADVDAFPGHIACDPDSRSELVVPLIVGGEVIGVLDLDSTLPARFDAADRQGCERLVAVLLGHYGEPATQPDTPRMSIRNPGAGCRCRGATTSTRTGNAPLTASPTRRAGPCAGSRGRAASNCTARNCRAARGRSIIICGTRPGSAGGRANWRSSLPRASSTASSNGRRTSRRRSPRGLRARSSTRSASAAMSLGWPRPTRIVIELGREIFGARLVSPATYARALQQFGRRKLVDLVALMGNYAATAAMLTAFAMQLDPAFPSPLPACSSRPGELG